MGGSFNEGMESATNSNLPASRNDRKGSSTVNMEGQNQD